MNRVIKSFLASHKDNEQRQQLLLSEYDRLMKCVLAHPCIHVKEVFGSPPEKYHLVYRVNGLLQAGKSVEPKNAHIVEIVLPDNYPNAPPVCSMLSLIFHPNILGDKIDIKEDWAAKPTLADIAVIIGQMIVFQRYSATSPLNKEAAQWAIHNKNLLPLSTVDFNRPAEAASSRSLTKAAVPAGAGRAAESKDTGEADTIIFEDAAAHLMMAGREPRDDDTAQLPVEKKAPPITAPPPLPQPRKKAPQAPALEKPRLLATGNVPGEITTDRTAEFEGPGVFCQRCGKKNITKANFCMRCGIRLPSLASQRKLRVAIAVGSIVILILIAEVGIIALIVNL